MTWLRRSAGYLLPRLLPCLTVGIGLVGLRSAWAALLGYHAGMLLVLGLAGEVRLPALLPGRVSGRDLIVAPGFGLAAGLLLWLGWERLGLAGVAAVLLPGWGLGRGSWLLFMLYFIGVNPWLEELYWRGWLGPAASLPALDDLWFALYHLLVVVPFAPPLAVILAFGGIALAGRTWRGLTARSGSLVPAVLSHFAADLSIFLVLSWEMVP